MRIGPTTFVWGARTYIMGVINVSPESFSGDGVATVDDAVEQARRFVDEGADILDVGGQSTRPAADKHARPASTRSRRRRRSAASCR